MYGGDSEGKHEFSTNSISISIDIIFRNLIEDKMYLYLYNQEYNRRYSHIIRIIKGDILKVFLELI